MPDSTLPPDPTEPLPAPAPLAPRFAAPLATAIGWRDDLVTASLFLTRLPLARLLRAPPPASAEALTHALRAFPLVGAAIGLIAALVYWVAALFGLAPLPGALLAVGATVLLTGGLHEDGLADCADGFGGGRDRDSKLAIMRDSRIGSYGVLA